MNWNEIHRRERLVLDRLDLSVGDGGREPTDREIRRITRQASQDDATGVHWIGPVRFVERGPATRRT